MNKTINKNTISNLPLLEKQYVILTTAELRTFHPQTELKTIFKKLYAYLSEEEDYERMAVLKKAEDRYLEQIKTK